MLTNASDLGDLGFGWKSFKNLAKRAYSVAAIPARAALRVANATNSVLCKNGVSQGSDSTTKSFCHAMKVKDGASVRKYLPQAAAIAGQAARAKQLTEQAEKARQLTAQIQAAYQAKPMAGAFGAYDPFAVDTDDNGRFYYVDRSAAGQAARMAYYRKHRGQMSYSTVFAPTGLNGLSAADTNLLASLAGADPNDLAFALAGVDPGDIGATMTRGDMVVLLPSTVAVLAGFWMLLRG